jgi:hypothetical protein
MTRGVADKVTEDEEFAKYTLHCLRRHMDSDWGDLDPEDRKENEFSVEHGFRVLSSYEHPTQPKLWVITEADRSTTTILFPSEY